MVITRRMTHRANLSIANKASPLIKLPRELQSHIFKELLTHPPNELGGPYMAIGRFNQPERITICRYKKSSEALLDRYGTICKALRVSV